MGVARHPYRTRRGKGRWCPRHVHALLRGSGRNRTRRWYRRGRAGSNGGDRERRLAGSLGLRRLRTYGSTKRSLFLQGELCERRHSIRFRRRARNMNQRSARDGRQLSRRVVERRAHRQAIHGGGNIRRDVWKWAARRRGGRRQLIVRLNVGPHSCRTWRRARAHAPP